MEFQHVSDHCQMKMKLLSVMFNEWNNENIPEESVR